MRLVVSILVLLLSIPLTTAVSIGVSPPRVIKNNLLPGSTLEEVIVLSKNGDEHLTIQTDIQGSAKEWIEHPTHLVFDQGIRTVYAPVNIAVPQQAESGNYEAVIQYFVIDESSNLHLAFSVQLTLTVITTPDPKYHIKHVQAIQEDRNTRISFEVFNTGNVPSGPTKAYIEITDSTQRNLLYEASEKVSKTDPFSVTQRNVTFDTHMREGYYWVHVILTDEHQEYGENIFLEIKDNSITGQLTKDVEQTSFTSTIVALSLLALVMVCLAIIARIRKQKDDAAPKRRP